MTAAGQVLSERYRLISRLGSGGQGSVWRARDQLLERSVALKELVPGDSGLNLTEIRVRALREARAMAKVTHPAIVRIHDFFHVGDDPWIVMDYISGRSLAAIIGDRPLDERTVAAIGLPVLRGLRAVHAAGIVHRDVKPANILRAEDGSVFLVDFGIARIDGDTSITGQSRVLGTTEFMAPERIRGRPADPPADLWSLGITLFWALEGYSPFVRRGEGGLQGTISAILHDPPPPPRRPGKLADVAQQMLRKEPLARPDAAAVEAVLVAVADGPHATALPPQAERAWASGSRSSHGPRTDHGARPDNPASKLPVADAVEILSSSSTDSGAALLLDMADDQAARILATCPREVAGQLIQGMAASHPQTAGSILQIFTARLAAQVLRHMNHGAAAAILTTMPVMEATRILNEAAPRIAAMAIGELPRDFAAQVLKVLDEPRAGEVLGHVTPSHVAILLAAVPPDLSARLLARLSPAFRALVRQRM